MSEKKYKGKYGTFVLESNKCCNSDFKASFLGGSCECCYCKVKVKSENNDRYYILSESEFEALEEVEERIEVIRIDNNKRLQRSGNRWTKQEREDIEKFLNVFGSWEKMWELYGQYCLDDKSQRNGNLFNMWLKEKGYDK